MCLWYPMSHCSSRNSELKPKIAIVNFHPGLPLCQKALFEELGADVSVIWHRRFANLLSPGGGWRKSVIDRIEFVFVDLYRPFRRMLIKLFPSRVWPKASVSRFPLRVYRLLISLGIMTVPEYVFLVLQRYADLYYPHHNQYLLQFSRNDKVLRKFFKNTDFIVFSFPPSLVRSLKEIADEFDITLINYLGHRFNLYCRTKERNILVKSLIKEIHNSPRHILASCSFYDVKYTRHYLNIDPLNLTLYSFHIPQKVTSPKNRTILIGPAQIRRDGFAKTDSAEKQLANRMYDGLFLELERERRSFYNANPTVTEFTFGEIKSIYPQYTFEQLAQHPAVVVFPYSSYGVSLEELYELNIPYFVPSVDFMIKYQLLYDRALPALWCSTEEYEQMEDDFNSPDSPNSYNDTALRKWIPFSSFYQKQNAIIFDDFADLMKKVQDLDQYGNELRQKMFDENSRRRDEILKQWRTVLSLSQ